MPLYGHELSLDIVPAQAGLGRVVAADKDDFVGRAGSRPCVATDAPVLVGLVSEGKRAGRAGYAVLRRATARSARSRAARSARRSGIRSPWRSSRPRVSAPGTELSIDVRGTRIPATVTALPFYRRTMTITTQPTTGGRNDRSQQPQVHRRARVDRHRRRRRHRRHHRLRRRQARRRRLRRAARRRTRASRPGRSSARSSRRSRSASSTRRSPATSSRSTTPSSTTRRSSTPTRSARAGSSSSASTRSAPAELLDREAYLALTGGEE